MAGVVGTAGMLAEASGCGAEIDVAAIPAPGGRRDGRLAHLLPRVRDAHRRRLRRLPHGIRRQGPALTETAAIGRLTAAAGVRLTWPDGETTTALPGPVTGLGHA